MSPTAERVNVNHHTICPEQNIILYEDHCSDASDRMLSTPGGCTESCVCKQILRKYLRASTMPAFSPLPCRPGRDLPRLEASGLTTSQPGGKPTSVLRIAACPREGDVILRKDTYQYSFLLRPDYINCQPIAFAFETNPAFALHGEID